jgi:hypothetical protein
VRRGLGRGRLLIAVGSVMAIVSMPLSWRQAGGIVLQVETVWGFAGAGRITFVAVVAMLALIVAPYATRSHSFGPDRPLAYALLLVVALVGLGQAMADLIGGDRHYGLTPVDAPGLWLAIAGMALVTWGVLELFAQGPTPP